MDEKTRPNYMFSTGNPLYKDTHGLKIKGWRRIYHANINQRKSGVAILISDKADQSKENYQG